MKKGILALTMAVVLAGSGLAYAGHEEGHGMMGGKGCPMMGGMMQKSMVATSDGGVVVQSGHKLIKYDKNLNVVKEAEVKMDTEGMHTQMQGMMKDCGCPMMKGKGKGTGEAGKASAASEDHSAHH
jgi:hypothetical protein